MMMNVKLYKEAFEGLTKFIHIEEDYDKAFARYLYKCDGDVEVLIQFVDKLENIVLDLHKLVYNVKEENITELYPDYYGCMTDEYYDNRAKYKAAQDTSFIEFLCSVDAELKSGKLSKEDVTKLCLLLLDDQLEHLTNGATVSTFELIVQDTQRLVDKVSDGLKDLQAHYDESNKNLEKLKWIIEFSSNNNNQIEDDSNERLEQIKGISLTIGDGEVSKVKKETITIVNDDFSHVTKKEIWDEYNEFIDRVSKFEIMLDELSQDYTMDSVEFKTLQKAIKLFDEIVDY